MSSLAKLKVIVFKLKAVKSSLCSCNVSTLGILLQEVPDTILFVYKSQRKKLFGNLGLPQSLIRSITRLVSAQVVGEQLGTFGEEEDET